MNKISSIKILINNCLNLMSSVIKFVPNKKLISISINTVSKIRGKL